MPRSKDYAAVPSAAVARLHRQPVACFVFGQQPGRANARVLCDFAMFGFRTAVALVLAEAYQWRHRQSGYQSIQSDWQTFRNKFVPWLKSIGLIDASLEDLVSNRTRDHYLRYVFDHTGWNARTAAKTYSRMSRHFEEVAKRNPSTDFTPRAFVTRGAYVSSYAGTSEIIPAPMFRKIRRALMAEIRQAWSYFEKGQAALERARAMAIQGKAPPLGATLEGILYYVHTEWNGLVPPRNQAPTAFRTAVSRYFNETRTRQLVDRFHLALDQAGVVGRREGRMEETSARYGISIARLKSVGTGRSGRSLQLSVLRRVAADAHVSLEWLLKGEGEPNREDSKQFLQWAEAATYCPSDGASEAVHRYLYATSDAICAYIAFLATETGANRDPILLWPRDVLVENVVMKNMFMLGTKEAELDKLGRLEWDKGRSVLRQRLFFADVGAWGPVNLIRQVLTLTEPLRMWAASEHRELLFLTYKSSPGKSSSAERAGRVISELFRRQMARIAAKYEIPTHYLTHRAIRATVISEEFLRTNRQLHAAQAVAGHASPDTTDRYLDNTLVRHESDLTIGRLQNRLTDAVRRGDLSIMIDPQRASPGSSVPEEALAGRAVQTDTGVTLAGGICQNVRGGYAKEARVGEVCTQWWSCFGCEGAVFVPIPRFVARWIQTAEHIEAQRSKIHPLKWRELYEPKLLLARERLLSVRPDVIEQARHLVPQLPPLPRLS